MVHGTTVPAAAAQAADASGHGCVDCEKVTEVELIYIKLDYAMPGASTLGAQSKYGQALHLSNLTFYRCPAKPEDLWGEAVTGATLEEKAKKVQKLAKTKAPIEDYLKKTPERAGVEQIYSTFCLNFDMGNGGADIIPGNDKWMLPTWEELDKTGGLWTYDSKSDYGLAPRLRVLKGWANASDTLVRFHCGKEYKAINATAKADPYPTKHSHISRDRRGKWTDLRSTAGCLRISTGDMLDLYDTLRPYTRLDFSWSSPNATNPLRNWQSVSTRSSKTKPLNPNLMVAYMFAEGKAGFCAIRDTPLNATFDGAMHRAFPDQMGPNTICQSALWHTRAHAPLLKFYGANPDE
jgi:hypothetical protein